MSKKNSLGSNGSRLLGQNSMHCLMNPPRSEKKRSTREKKKANLIARAAIEVRKIGARSAGARELKSGRLTVRSPKGK